MITTPEGINDNLEAYLNFPAFLLAGTFREITHQKFSLYLISEVDKFTGNEALSEMQDIFIKSSSKKRKRRKDLLQERLVGVRPPSPEVSSLHDNLCLLCRFCGAAGAGGGGGGGAFLKVSALRFCGRHAGDQGSERTDRAGLEPPGSLGAPLFNHSAAKQSDGELHMPLVSPVSFCLRLHLSGSASLTFSQSSRRCCSSLGPRYESGHRGARRIRHGTGEDFTVEKRVFPEGSNRRGS